MALLFCYISAHGVGKLRKLSAACAVAEGLDELLYLLNGELARSFSHGGILYCRGSNAANARNGADRLAAGVVDLREHLCTLCVDLIGEDLEACYLLVLPKPCEVIRCRSFGNDAYILGYYKAEAAAGLSFMIGNELLGRIAAVAAVALLNDFL